MKTDSYSTAILDQCAGDLDESQDVFLLGETEVGERDERAMTCFKNRNTVARLTKPPSHVFGEPQDRLTISRALLYPD